MKVFFSVESSLPPGPITCQRIGLSAEDGRSFYGEVMHLGQVLREQRVKREAEPPPSPEQALDALRDDEAEVALGEKDRVAAAVLDWLADFGSVEMWGDNPEPGWGLLCAFLGGADCLPPGVHGEPFDLRALFHSRGVAATIEPMLASQATGHMLAPPALHRAIRLREWYMMLAADTQE